LGFPKTDETKTPDGQGRYNHFQGGSIYWHPILGAWEVHGDIRDRWASLGWEQSYLGYPTQNESLIFDPQTNETGRISYFQYGHIYWFPKTGAIDVPESRSFNSGNMTFKDATPVNGWAWLVIEANGHFRYGLHVHDSGTIPYHVSAAAIVGTGRADDDSLRIMEGGAFGVTHSGWVYAPIGKDHYERSGEGNSPLLSELWPFFRNGTFYPGLTAADFLSTWLTDIHDSIQHHVFDPLFNPDKDTLGSSQDMREDIRNV
jgi:hypothetical protein